MSDKLTTGDVVQTIVENTPFEYDDIKHSDVEIGSSMFWIEFSDKAYSKIFKVVLEEYNLVVSCVHVNRVWFSKLETEEREITTTKTVNTIK